MGTRVNTYEYQSLVACVARPAGQRGEPPAQPPQPAHPPVQPPSPHQPWPRRISARPTQPTTRASPNPPPPTPPAARSSNMQADPQDPFVALGLVPKQEHGLLKYTSDASDDAFSLLLHAVVDQINVHGLDQLVVEHTTGGLRYTFARSEYGERNISIQSEDIVDPHDRYDSDDDVQVTHSRQVPPAQLRVERAARRARMRRNRAPGDDG